MADDVAISEGDADKTVRSEDIGGKQHQYVVPVWGPAGTANKPDVATGKPLPTQVRSATGLIPFGEPTDAKSTATDTTNVGFTALFKQISFSIQAAAASLASLVTSGGAATDAKSTATDTTAVSWTSLLKQISASVQSLVGSVISMGTAGSAASAVMSVQGIASMTPIAAGGITAVVDVTLSLDTGAYGSGDLLAATQQVDAALRVADGTGILQSLTVIDKDDQKAAFTVYILSANNSFGSENSAPSISDADAAAILAVIDVAVADYKDLGGVSVAQIRNLAIPVKAVSGTDDLYVAVVNSTGTPTYTASGVVLRLGILRD